MLKKDSFCQPDYANTFILNYSDSFAMKSTFPDDNSAGDCDTNASSAPARGLVGAWAELSNRLLLIKQLLMLYINTLKKRNSKICSCSFS